MSSIARPLGQVSAGKDLGRNTTKSILVSVPWFLWKYHRRSALKATIIIRCSVWDELRMFRPIRWIKNTVADPRKGSYAREKGVTIYKQCSGR